VALGDALRHLTALTRLAVRVHRGAGEATVAAAATLPRLESLVLIACPRIRGPALAHLAGADALRTLFLNSCSAEHLAPLARCANLRKLTMRPAARRKPRQPAMRHPLDSLIAPGNQLATELLGAAAGGDGEEEHLPDATLRALLPAWVQCSGASVDGGGSDGGGSDGSGGGGLQYDQQDGSDEEEEGETDDEEEGETDEEEGGED